MPWPPCPGLYAQAPTLARPSLYALASTLTRPRQVPCITTWHALASTPWPSCPGLLLAPHETLKPQTLKLKNLKP